MTLNGHVTGDQIGLVYATPQWFDESMLCSHTRRLVANVVLQLDVLPPKRTSGGQILFCTLC